MRTSDIGIGLVLLAGFWFAALLVALSDIDFFSLQDLFDFTEPHHEHVVVALGFAGLLAAGISLLRGWHRQDLP